LASGPFDSVDKKLRLQYFGRMSRTRFGLLIAFCLLLPCSLLAQRSFPSPSAQLHDVKFKVTEPPPPKEGKYVDVDGRRFVRVDPTPTRINSLSFSNDGKLLAAGKDFGRLVLWDVASERVLCVINTGLTRVGLVAIAPDDQIVAASPVGGLGIKLFHIPDGRLVNSFETGNFAILRLMYTFDSSFLIVSTNATFVLDTTSGAHAADFPGEDRPVLSSDGSTLMTASKSTLILRSARDWKEQRRLPKLIPYERPIFLDLARGLFIFEDTSDEHVFVAARLSDGQMPTDLRLANLPKPTPLYYNYGFAAIDPHSDLLLGDSGDQVWSLDMKTGETCLSPYLFSGIGAISPDGSLLAGTIDSGTPTENQKKAGVDIWKTSDLAKACHMQ
jgi:WD40 repeat protein